MTERDKSQTTDISQSSDVRSPPGVEHPAIRHWGQGPVEQEQVTPDTKMETPEVPPQVP